MSEGICGYLVKQCSDTQQEAGHWVTGGRARRWLNVGCGGLLLYEKILIIS